MLNKAIDIRNRLEREKSIPNKFFLSNMYLTIFDKFLSPEEQLLEAPHMKSMEFVLGAYSPYNYLVNDKDIFTEFFNKTSKKYEDADFYYYGLYPSNKLDLKEAGDIAFDILDSMSASNNSNFKELYKFDRVKFANLDGSAGCCLNTFRYYDDPIFIDEKIDKMATFIRVLLHELGHSYENLFMSSMSSLQQIDRYNYAFVEVMSSFFEKIALEYMLKNKIYFDDTQREINLNYCDLYDRLNFLNDLCNIKELENCVYDEEKILCTIDGTNYSFCNYGDAIKYGYGALLGEYFYNIYKDDKKEGFKAIRDFLSNQVIYDERKMLDSINFGENNFDFLDEGLNNNMNYMRKRYKW